MSTPSPKYCNPQHALQILRKIRDSGLLSLATWGVDLEIIRTVLSAARPPGAIDANKIADRLDELADYVTQGPDCVRRNFHMSVPARVYEDPDLVMVNAAMLIRGQANRPTDAEIAALLRELAQSIDQLVDDVGLPEEKNGKLAADARAMADQLEPLP